MDVTSKADAFVARATRFATSLGFMAHLYKNYNVSCIAIKTIDLYNVSMDMEWRNVRIKLGDLKPWEHNPRKISRSHARRILESWQRYGQAQLILIGPSNEVYDGHQRLSVLLAAYGPQYEVEARQSVRELTEDERQRLVIMLHAGTVGEWDWEQLRQWDIQLLNEAGLDHESVEAWKRDYKLLTGLLADQALSDVVPVELSDDMRLDVADEEGLTCPKCGYRINGKAKD